MSFMQLIAVREKKAASMLDMTVDQFRALVEQGALPAPITIGEHQRWRVDQLNAILDGKSAIPNEDFTL